MRLLLFGVMLVSLRAQDAPRPRFDSAEIRRAGSLVARPTPGTRLHFFGLRYEGRKVTCNTSLSVIAAEAWSLNEWQIQGPDWFANDAFELAAVMPENTGRADARRMLRTLLEERFALRAHRIEKQASVYGLVEVSGGAHLTPGLSGAAAREHVFITPLGPLKVTSIFGAGRYSIVSATLDDFAAYLTHRLDAPAVNLTAFDGAYLIDLQWKPTGTVRNQPHLDPALELEIERSLGLRLVRQKSTFPFLVIDHVERQPASP